MTPVPPAPPISLSSDFFLFPWLKKGLTGKRFADGEEVKQKTAETQKGIKINKVKHCFEQWEKRLNGCTASVERTLKVPEVEIRKNKYTISYK